MQSSFSVKINEKENKNNIFKMKISLPIDIVNVNEYINKPNDNDLNNEEYSLNFNNFNPNKASPPSEWKERLENRIKIHYTYKLEKE